MKRKVLAGLCVFSLIYSCSKDDVLPIDDSVREGDEIVGAFVPKFVKQDWVVSDSTGTNRPDTRAWNEQWTGGEEIGIYMIKKADDFDLSEAIFKNKMYKVKTPPTGEIDYAASEKMYYPLNNDTKVQFVAYCPYDATATSANMAVYTFANQSTTVQKEAADFIFHKRADEYSSSTNTPVALSFKHKFSKIRIHIKQGNSGFSCLNATAKLTGMPASATVNLKTLAKDQPNAITLEAIGEITPQRVSSTATEAIFEAIVPPHLGTDYTSRTFKFTVNSEVYTYYLPSTFNFGSGKAYGFELTLGERGAPLDMWDGLSNCYIVAPGTTSDAIRIERAITVGGMDAATDNADITLYTLWDDNEVIVTDGISTLSGSGADRTFTVTVANKQGNAVVALKMGGKIYWSWHIWVSNYSGQTWTNNGYTLMDRNLGATENQLTHASRGLYYQYGRKDPFPGDVTGAPGFKAISEFKGIIGSGDATGHYVTNRYQVVGGTRVGILEAIRNPTTFYWMANGQRFWLPMICYTLWNAENDKKSVYDPCPDGYRVPLMAGGITNIEHTKTFHQGLTWTVTYSPLPGGETDRTYNGKFPYNGYINMNMEPFGSHKGVGSQMSIAYANLAISGDLHLYSIYSTSAINLALYVLNTGAGVRCCTE
jgi:hypothetical protein